MNVYSFIISVLYVNFSFSLCNGFPFTKFFFSPFFLTFTLWRVIFAIFNVLFLFLLLSFLFVGNTIQLIGVNVTFLGLRFRRWFHLMLCLPCSVRELYYFLFIVIAIWVTGSRSRRGFLWKNGLGMFTDHLDDFQRPNWAEKIR